MANLSFYIISSQLTHCSSKQIDSLIFSFLHKFLVLRMNFSFPLGFLKQEEVFTLVEQGRAQVWSQKTLTLSSCLDLWSDYLASVFTDKIFQSYQFIDYQRINLFLQISTNSPRGKILNSPCLMSILLTASFVR